MNNHLLLERLDSVKVAYETTHVFRSLSLSLIWHKQRKKENEFIQKKKNSGKENALVSWRSKRSHLKTLMERERKMSWTISCPFSNGESPSGDFPTVLELEPQGFVGLRGLRGVGRAVGGSAAHAAQRQRKRQQQQQHLWVLQEEEEEEEAAAGERRGGKGT